MSKYACIQFLLLTFKRQLLFTNKFPGLMSLCKIPAEWRYLSPARKRKKKELHSHEKDMKVLDHTR